MKKAKHRPVKRPARPVPIKKARKGAPRLSLDEREELYRLRAQVREAATPPAPTEALSSDERDQLRRARKVMETNDPGNALAIFGPPLSVTAPEEGAAPKEEFPFLEGDAPARAEDVNA
ncbi:MAG TPA: hypothetical protein VFB63_19520 [Bryobacteraceae bacterium]|nr:hypothetical protein [Bryobacteraceae bacterium]